jgi:hypothetical protein
MIRCLNFEYCMVEGNTATGTGAWVVELAFINGDHQQQ